MPLKFDATLKGLAEGDRIIVSGMQRVRKGAPVDVEMQAAPEPPRSQWAAPEAPQPAKPAKPADGNPVSRVFGRLRRSRVNSSGDQ